MHYKIFNQFVGASFIAIYILSYYISPLAIGIIIVLNILSIGYSLYVSKLEKAKLKDMLFCIRQGLSAKRFILPLIFFIGYYVFEYFLDDYLGLSDKDDNSFYYMLPLFFAMWIVTKQQIFIDSIRVFKEGLKLPGSTSKIIKWSNITSIEFENESITITTSKKLKSFKVLKADIQGVKTLRKILDQTRTY